MLSSSIITKIIFIISNILWIGIPLWYLLLYVFINRKKKKKNYGKALMVAIILFLILSFVRLLFRIDIELFKVPNCYINNICEERRDDNIKDKDDQNTTTPLTTTEKKTTTTTTTTTAVKKEKEYQKISEPSGEKKTIGTSSKGYTIYTIDDVTYVDGYLIANKTYALPKDYTPKNAYATTNTPEKACQNCINKTAYAAWKELYADAQAVGIKLWIQSGYRSYVLQNTLYNNYIKREKNKGMSDEAAKAEADTYSARPGYSEHQTGECFDLNNAGRNFNGTKEAAWVDQNAYKYGFIIRYPEGKTDETGYIYESWHLRYVGTDLSYKLYNNGDWITMEDYFGLTSKYAEE